MLGIPSSSASSATSEASLTKVRRASVASISRQPKASTEQALKGYAYLKSRSSRSRSPNSAASA